MFNMVEVKAPPMMLKALRLAVLLALPGQAPAETIVDCGASKGWAFYPDIDSETGKPFGWVEDGITAGGVALVREGEDFDIIIRDAIGMMSARSEGGNVTVLDVHDSAIDVLVAYPAGAKELFTFDLSARRLFWTQHKVGVAFDKVAAFVADCN